MIRRPALAILTLAILAMLAMPLTASAQTAPAPGPVKMEWFGWSFFRFTTSSGTVVLVNPFANNPDSPIKAADITKADLIFAADGHGDEQGSTVEIAQATGATVFVPGELGSWMIEQGVPRAQVVPFAAPGDRIRVGGVTARMVGSVHSSGLPKPSAAVPYGGIAAGVFLTFDNGYTVYFAGSSAMQAEQAIWADMYKPHLAILHMFVNHDPLDFAQQAKNLRNPNLDAIMPHHHRVTQAAGTTSVADAQAALNAAGVTTRLVAPTIGTVYTLTPPR
jgi:L-ascorbate metabolism protein UlaG (beta-lactamase superfamily)